MTLSGVNTFESVNENRLMRCRGYVTMVVQAIIFRPISTEPYQRDETAIEWEKLPWVWPRIWNPEFGTGRAATVSSAG